MADHVMLRCGDGAGVAVEMHKLYCTGLFSGLVSFDPPLIDHDLGVNDANGAIDENGNAMPTCMSILLPKMKGSTVALLMQWLNLYWIAPADPLYKLGMDVGEEPPLYIPYWAAQFFVPLTPGIIARLAHGAEYLAMPYLSDMVHKVIVNSLYALHDEEKLVYVAGLGEHSTDPLI